MTPTMNRLPETLGTTGLTTSTPNVLLLHARLTPDDVDCTTLALPSLQTANCRFFEVDSAFAAVDALLPVTSDRIWYRSAPRNFRNKRVVVFRVDLLLGLLILTLDPPQFVSN